MLPSLKCLAKRAASPMNKSKITTTTTTTRYSVVNLSPTWIFWTIFSLMTAFSMANHHDKLTLSPPHGEVVHYVNDSHIVFCNGHNNTRLRWLSPTNGVIEEKKGRIHVEENPKGSISLVFESISLLDKGDWTCHGEDGIKKSFNLVVNQPITFMDTPVVQSAREGKDTVINCTVEGDPEPTISWYFNGQILNLQSNKYTKIKEGLSIRKVGYNDSGEYSCRAFQVSRTVSNVMEQTIRFNIEHKPILPPRKASAEITFGYINGQVNLTCEAEAEPAANFTWYRHNKKLSSKVHLINTVQHSSTLQVLVNDSNAFGDYKCKAQNSLGLLERNISLKEGTKPERPDHVSLRGYSSDTFDVDVGATRKTKERHEMDINGYRFEIISVAEYRANEGKWDKARILDVGFEDGITYLINNLAANTKYLLRVASKNPAGLSDFTVPKEFTTHPKEPFGLVPSSSNQFFKSSINSVIITIMGFIISFIIISSNRQFYNFHKQQKNV